MRVVWWRPSNLLLLMLPSFMAVRAIPIASPSTTAALSLELGTAAAFNSVRRGYVGFTLSFLTGTDYGELWANTSIVTIDLDKPQFVTLVSELAPGMLRVGGGGEYRIVMDVDGKTCAASKTPASYCLTMARWREILAFAHHTGVQLIWGLGAQRRKNGTSPLDTANIAAFLSYTATLGPSILSSSSSPGGLLGFELGNELDGGDYTTGIAVNPSVLAADYRSLKAMISQHWPKTDARPLLAGPAMHMQATWARLFLSALGPHCLDIFTFHDYVGYGLDPQLPRKLLDPAFLTGYWDQAVATIEMAKALQPSASVMVGETSAAWHSGQCGTTNRFAGSFWYANALGRMARGGVQGLARHSLNGGCYAMFNRSSPTMQPHPDYWLTLLGPLLDW